MQGKAIVDLFQMKNTVIVGERYIGALEKSLTKFGFDILPLPGNPYVDPQLAFHSDLSVFSPGNQIIFLAKYLKNTEFEDRIRDLGIKIQYISEKQQSIYPDDVQLNAKVLNKNIVFFNKKTISKDIFNFYKEKQYSQEKQIIHVRQGYTACCTLCCRNSIITSDNGIYEAAQKNNISVLKISAGNIQLTGYDYGFIGGSAFEFENTVYFTGVLSRHPDQQKIEEFISSQHMEIQYLTEKPIFDIGGVVVIKNTLNKWN